jgi:type I restriction enzyme S subunit
MSISTWKTTTLADADKFEYLNGLWKGKKPPFEKAVVVRNTNFRNDGILDLSDVAVLDVEARQLQSRRLCKGDIIIERSGGGPKQPVGRVCYFNVDDARPHSFSNFTTTLRVKDREVFLPLFVHYNLLHLYQTGFTFPLQRATTGIRNLDFGAYQEAEIQMPPKSVQEKIAAVLWKIQRATKTEEKLVRTTCELKQSAMHQLFTNGLRGGPRKNTPFGDVPRSWEIKALSQWAFVQGGATKGRMIHPEEAIDVPYLRVANVQDGHLDLTEMKTIRIRRDELDGYRLQRDDVVLTEGGDFDKLGRGSIWDNQIDPCIHQNHIFAVRVNRDVLWPRYFAYLAQSAYGKAYFLTVAHKTTNLACINTTKLRAFPVLRPELDEQKEIADILQTIDRKISVHERKRAALSDLFQTMLHQLMTAQIRVDKRDIDTSEVAALNPVTA